ncbi:cupin domain-containing protein [Natronocalculus amylovorans]|uniref:Cupin domain-containing protein n=1 Tax=Natronocalculus amylovorans TaxID=2917812 RepID=A0AAE3K8K2_9EURY|nr:cupin domain-containing protein [Natronocalculus amylovorans]MCL9816610.1 cupin domain-containing protein [Natronocalculus amylovorans]
MVTPVNIDAVERRELDAGSPALRAIGYELRPEKMRPNVWEYTAGETNRKHTQREQEELYLVLSGRFECTVDGEVLELEPDDVLVLPPTAARQLTAIEDSRLLVVGAPNVKDDGIPIE